MGERKTIQHSNLTFILDDKITVSTGYQSFHLEPVDHRWRIKLEKVRKQIQDGDIETIIDLASVCGTEIKWVTTYHD